MPSPTRVATLAVAGLERLAVSLATSAPPDDTGTDYVIGRVRELAADIRLDALPDESGDKMLYFAEAVGAHRVKIGISSDPQARLASLRTACPHDLRIIGIAPGGRSTEAALHAKLADYHLGGEWFLLAKPVRSLIDRLTAAGFDGASSAAATGAKDRGGERRVSEMAWPQPASAGRTSPIGRYTVVAAMSSARGKWAARSEPGAPRAFAPVAARRRKILNWRINRRSAGRRRLPALWSFGSPRRWSV